MALDVKNFGADPVRVEVVALLRHAVEMPVDKSGSRAVGIVLPSEQNPQRALDLLNWEATVDDDLAVADLLEKRGLLVILVVDLADDVDAISTQLPEQIV